VGDRDCPIIGGKVEEAIVRCVGYVDGPVVGAGDGPVVCAQGGEGIVSRVSDEEDHC